MTKAVVNGVVIASSDDTVVVEGNHYFPPGSLRKEFFEPTETHTLCPWKGRASYYTVEVADTEPDALARLFKFDERFYRLRRNGGEDHR